MNKKLMVIGAGFGQIPAIEKAKQMGLSVITIDKNPNAIGMKLADFAYPIDVVDVEQALLIAKKHNIDGVMTMQTDLPVPTVGSIIDELELHGSGYDVAMRCSNKIKTRQAFKKRNVPQPDFKVVENIEEAKNAAKRIGFPCIIKAPDSSGSRGVVKVNSESDIESALNEAFKYTKSKQVLLEEYIRGVEIGAQGFSIDGSCVKVLVHNDTVMPPPYMVPTGHSFPSSLNEEEERNVKKAVASAVDALGIPSGPSNIDLILNEDNNPLIIEIGARIGATCLPELVYYYSGIDWVKQTILSCLGENVEIQQSVFQPVVAYIMQSHKDGIVRNIEIPDHVQSHKCVKEVEVSAKIGDEVNILRKGTDRIGKIVVTGDTLDEANQLALKMIDEITIDVE